MVVFDEANDFLHKRLKIRLLIILLDIVFLSYMLKVLL
ncbi:MAG: hypothetical protein UT97_C0019G0012 [Parcubacteria group bacterium GW2011_GWC2_40_31]|nr:MAG: hypothetical protein UT71_C0022G0012 [Parcubacteria group bacterium GW2011_GWF2_40_10]KKR47467.1 MAG: hypothetical protein UT83_C0009G0033 [Parcubacteria group bacterium GW2011_GWA2_40_143]KKR58972.1 MAG: hypothetical protein UT97_C0019G0012 [Parcubacteria group bacterium GW2011_GWC2_40_31]KKR76004.1 MAG: hypothetical protein UU20_C0036G0005 [Parcubacteria group bacterium GW2011_GWE2_40_8]KKR82201.1 MAG: hypothetical protein UU28_C0013G0012 [Parcubacteria group bacterium GW2011_GWD2_40_